MRGTYLETKRGIWGGEDLQEPAYLQTPFNFIFFFFIILWWDPECIISVLLVTCSVLNGSSGSFHVLVVPRDLGKGGNKDVATCGGFFFGGCVMFSAFFYIFFSNR